MFCGVRLCQNLWFHPFNPLHWPLRRLEWIRNVDRLPRLPEKPLQIFGQFGLLGDWEGTPVPLREMRSPPVV